MACITIITALLLSFILKDVSCRESRNFVFMEKCKMASLLVSVFALKDLCETEGVGQSYPLFTVNI